MTTGSISREAAKRKTREEVHQRLEARVGSGQWLHNRVRYDHTLRIVSPWVEVLFNDLYSGKRINKRADKLVSLQILLANLLKQKRLRPLAVSRSKHGWIHSRYTHAGFETVELIDLLYNRGLLEMKKGFHFDKGNARITRIWPTKLLLEEFPVLPNEIIIEPGELVVMKSKKIKDGNIRLRGKLIDYTETAKSRTVRKILETANKVNSSVPVTYGKFVINPFLYAVFIKNFSLYGRLHTRGYRHIALNYQAMASEDRPQIKIGGEPVVELDYSGLHPRLLYAQEGIQYDEDPYSVVDSRPEVRRFLKTVLLCLVNGKDDTHTERGANKHILDHWDILSDLGVVKARPWIAEFKKVHAPIAHHFSVDDENGLRLMNLDSKIALDVVHHFTKQKKQILAVHDSFIVQRRYEDELHQVMDQVYQKHTGGFRCPIK